MSAPWDIEDDWTTRVPARRRAGGPVDEGLGPLLARVIEWQRTLTPRTEHETIRT